MLRMLNNQITQHEGDIEEENIIAKSSGMRTPEKSRSLVHKDVTNSPLVITPHKPATFRTPPRDSTSRKRRVNPNHWKKNVRKRLRFIPVLKGYLSLQSK